MIHTYNITGMTCSSCVAKVKSALLKLGDVTEAQVQLTSPQATISMQKHIPVGQLTAPRLWRNFYQCYSAMGHE